MTNKIYYAPDLDTLVETAQEFNDLINEIKNQALSFGSSQDLSDVSNVVLINQKLVESFNTIKYIKKIYNKKFSATQQELKDAIVLHPLFENELFGTTYEYDKVKTTLEIGKQIKVMPKFANKDCASIKDSLIAKHPGLLQSIDAVFPTTVSFNKDKIDPLFIEVLKQEDLIESQEQLSIDLV